MFFQARIHRVPLVKSTAEIDTERETEEVQQLRQQVISMNMQLKQLNEANQAWQEYQQNQVILLRDRLKLNDVDQLSFEDIVQQIENRCNILNDRLIELEDTSDKHNEKLPNVTKDGIYQSKGIQTEENKEYEQLQQDQYSRVCFLISRIFFLSSRLQISTQAFTSHKNQYGKELHENGENLAALTAQNRQLDEATQAWRQYHQSQLDTFKKRLQNFLSIPLDDLSFDDLLQHIIVPLEQLQNVREILQEQLQTNEKLVDRLRCGNRLTLLSRIHFTHFIFLKNLSVVIK